ncbi:MAG: type I DNA topoisomerase, partial [Actinomycetota bacterium]|nr:type I DNA topoisomerase [Actinomycetota bacterium]
MAAAKRDDDSGSAGRRLVIVESPAKARKIASYLGSNYVVESSRGHIRDLPRGAADVPAKYKGLPWARLGVDVDNAFEPLYVVSPEKKSTVTELRSALKDADELLLATDGDREGEAIAWHLLETLKPKVPVRRMVFHEITEPAIRAAAANPRELDQDLVDAQETRRILDRLYGYEVSPVLWKKVMPKLSAGRVQSVATRIIVQRERERMAFVAASYWDIAASLDAGAQAAPRVFDARLVAVDGARVATGRDFGPDGTLRGDATPLDEAHARRLAEALDGAELAVSSVESKPYTRRPYAPFMTSTLQQEASRKLRFSAERTMRTAQRLYEAGYITYMRTDSTTLSPTAIEAARSQARELYGEAYVPDSPRQYTRKVKNAQEAHEAIRPSGEAFRTPGEVAREVDGDEFRLYEIIWQRTVASQMADARGTTMSVRINGMAGTGEEATFAASGRTITFPGFLKAYVETVDDQAGGEADDAESRLPQLTQGQPLTAAELTPEG